MTSASVMTDVREPVPARPGHVRRAGARRRRRPMGGATPCTEWDVRALVNHVLGEIRWAVPLFAGSTIAEVGDRFDGDLLGDDPVGRVGRGRARGARRGRRTPERWTGPCTCRSATSPAASTPCSCSPTCWSTAGTCAGHRAGRAARPGAGRRLRGLVRRLDRRLSRVGIVGGPARTVGPDAGAQACCWPSSAGRPCPAG